MIALVISNPILETTPEFTKSYTDALIACGQRLRQEGIDLGTYNTTESAADVNDIRLALGYEKVNLFGGSYGTRLGQEVMRKFSANLRAVVLDAVIPPEINRPADTPNSIENSLQNVFKACKNDENCNKNYPNLEQIYSETHEKLEKNPLSIAIDGQKITFNGEVFQAFVFGSLYGIPYIAELPKLIYATYQGNGDFLAKAQVNEFNNAVAKFITLGVFYATECRGEVAFSSSESVEATYKLLPQWRSTFNALPSIASESIFGVCQAWGLTEPSADENVAVKSDVPTLLLAGQFDPVTPPRYLELVSKGLPRSFSIELPAQSHTTFASPCGLSIVQAFFVDPLKKPNTNCKQSIKLEFDIP